MKPFDFSVKGSSERMKRIEHEPEFNQIIPAYPDGIATYTYCYDEQAKNKHSQAMRRVYRAAAKQLPGFIFKVHFNRGGFAVWGETIAKIYQNDNLIALDGGLAPVVEAYDTSIGLLVRQWDGQNSGHNHYVKTLDQFVRMVKELASKPFVRF